MGMRDESWCNGCGTSVPYSDEEEVYCGDCSSSNVVSSIAYIIKQRLDEYRPKLEALYNVEGIMSNDEASDEDWYQGYIDGLEYILIQLDKLK